MAMLLGRAILISTSTSELMPINADAKRLLTLLTAFNIIHLLSSDVTVYRTVGVADQHERNMALSGK